MVDFLNIPLDLNSVAQMASANAMGFWITIVLNLVLSTIVGGIVLIIVLGVFNRIYGEMLDYKKAFLVVFLANLINMVGIVGLLTPFIAGIPFIGIILPLLIWVVLLKLFFEDMSFLHALVIGAVFFALTIIAIPYLIGLAGAYLPF
jgi:hypothetical protein